MANKKVILISSFVGSTIGGFVPALWGASMMSISGVIWSVIGGFAGIWAGFKLSDRF